MPSIHSKHAFLPISAEQLAVIEEEEEQADFEYKNQAFTNVLRDGIPLGFALYQKCRTKQKMTQAVLPGLMFLVQHLPAFRFDKEGNLYRDRARVVLKIKLLRDAEFKRMYRLDKNLSLPLPCQPTIFSLQ